MQAQTATEIVVVDGAEAGKVGRSQRGAGEIVLTHRVPVALDADRGPGAERRQIIARMSL